MFSIPYFNTVEPVIANYDAVNARQRFDYYGGLTTYLTLSQQNVAFEVLRRWLDMGKNLTNF